MYKLYNIVECEYLYKYPECSFPMSAITVKAYQPRKEIAVFSTSYPLKGKLVTFKTKLTARWFMFKHLNSKENKLSYIIVKE